MTAINLSEAGPELSKLVERLEAGEEIMLVREGKTIAKVVPTPPAAQEAKPGSAKGMGWMADDFDAPLSDEELRDWGAL